MIHLQDTYYGTDSMNVVVIQLTKEDHHRTGDEGNSLSCRQGNVLINLMTKKRRRRIGDEKSSSYG